MRNTQEWSFPPLSFHFNGSHLKAVLEARLIIQRRFQTIFVHGSLWNMKILSGRLGWNDNSIIGVVLCRNAKYIIILPNAFVPNICMTLPKPEMAYLKINKQNNMVHLQIWSAINSNHMSVWYGFWSTLPYLISAFQSISHTLIGSVPNIKQVWWMYNISLGRKIRSFSSINFISLEIIK